MSNLISLRLCFIAAYLFKICLGAKILMVTAMQQRSHVLEQIVLSRALSDRGHAVYLALGSRYPADEQTLGKSGINVIRYHVPVDAFYSGVEYERFLENLVYFDREGSWIDWLLPGSQANEFLITSEMTLNGCQHMMEDRKFLKIVNDTNFDLAIAEPFILCPCSLILPKHLGIRYISMTHNVFPWYIGSPALPSFYPLQGPTDLTSEMTFMERMMNMRTYFAAHVMLTYLSSAANISLLEQFTPGITSWRQLVSDSELFMWQVDYRMDYGAPLMPHIIQVPGLSTRPADPLSEEFNSIVNSTSSRMHGVILVSFGSSAYRVPLTIMSRFMSVFKSLNQTIVARMKRPSTSETVTVPSNVHLFDWLPQNDLLGHANTRLFLTHCGNNGQYEALYHGVPMVGFALFAEQVHNCARMKAHGFSPRSGLNIRNFSEEELLSAILESLYNATYRSNIRHASAVWADEPERPIQLAVRWIERVLKFGGSHLRTPAKDMPMYQLLMLDVLFVILITILMIAVVLFKIIQSCCRMAFRCRPVETKLKTN